jgi:hypothetical protein
LTFGGDFKILAIKNKSSFHLSCGENQVAPNCNELPNPGISIYMVFFI